MLFLDISPEAARLRGGYGEERYEKEETQRKVREVFEKFGTDTHGWVRVDAGKDKDEVWDEMWRQIEPLTKGVENPIEKLWPKTLEA